MSIKDKLLNALSANPKAITLAISLGVTLAIGTVIGMSDNSHLAFALRVKPV
jgi:hypothetical protein